MTAPRRMLADLSAYPDLVVIFLGMRVEDPRGYETLQRLGQAVPAEGPMFAARARAEADRAAAGTRG